MLSAVHSMPEEGFTLLVCFCDVILLSCGRFWRTDKRVIQ